MKLSVYFDGSYWCGLVEYTDEKNNYRAIKYLFGKEPKEPELLAFVTNDLLKLVRKNDSLVVTDNQLNVPPKKNLNPKRIQRQLNRERKKPIFSTKAQLAIAEARGELKISRKKQSKEQRIADQQRKFTLKQAKKQQKKKGH